MRDCLKTSGCYRVASYKSSDFQRISRDFADLLEIRDCAKYQKLWAPEPCLHLMAVVIFVVHLVHVVMEVGARNQSNILTSNQHHQLCCRLKVEVLLMKRGPF